MLCQSPALMACYYPLEHSDLDRVSDTEITVELEFNGDFDTDTTLTFTVEGGCPIEI